MSREIPSFEGPKYESGPESKAEKAFEDLPISLCGTCKETGEGCMYLNLKTKPPTINDDGSINEGGKIWYKQLDCPNYPED